MKWIHVVYSRQTHTHITHITQVISICVHTYTTHTHTHIRAADILPSTVAVRSSLPRYSSIVSMLIFEVEYSDQILLLILSEINPHSEWNRSAVVEYQPCRKDAPTAYATNKSVGNEWDESYLHEASLLHEYPWYIIYSKRCIVKVN